MKQVFKLFIVGACMIGSMFILNSCNSSGDKDASATTDTTMTTATSTDTTMAASSDTTTSASTPAKLTDPEIASVAVTADQIDIDYAQIAKKKSKNKEVLEFASTMERDHGNVNKQAEALAKKLGVTPQDNPVTQSLLAQATTTKDMLNSKSGSDFDKAYVDNEVAYHKAAIGVVENTLIPDATNPELKSLLQSALPIFKGHLAHAEKIQAALSK